MRVVHLFIFIYLWHSFQEKTFAQTTSLANFTSLAPALQSDSLFIPKGYSFQTIAERDDPMADGNTFPRNFDFTGYVPINGSSENGYLSINSEYVPGAVSIMNIAFDNNTKSWKRSNEKAIDFSQVIGTVANCSGTVTPWNTIITCEEIISKTDFDNNSYNDAGWAIEIDPVTKNIVNNEKIWALGNFAHENVVIHSNQRTAYQGADSNPGYLFKFVADIAQHLNTGKLYAYSGSKNGPGNWLLLNNTTPAERNSTMEQAANLGATSFAGIEDVEISPIDGKVYVAVKGESSVYRFQDSDPLIGTTVTNFETFVGGASQAYDVSTEQGIFTEPWGTGNDNLAFDNAGNLWVLQDGSRNYVWTVGLNHSQANPDVKIFMRTPAGSEPTGLTFSPDNKFMFMSIQHPSGANNSSSQNDVRGIPISFNKDAAIIIALNKDWGINPCVSQIFFGNTILPGGQYQSSSKIESSSIIKPTVGVRFLAKDYILLKTGFFAELGSIFLSEIGSCEN